MFFIRNSLFATAIMVVVGIDGAVPAVAGTAQATLGNARFTVITPNLIRIQYSNGGEFTDAPTLFADNRDARFDGAAILQKPSHLWIDTGAVVLSYASDGKPFSSSNLRAVIHRGNETTTWTPGMADPLNLGGTLRTLDTCTGPRDLGQGVISRSGWAVVDDSGAPVLTNDWVRSRPNQAERDWYLFAYGLDYKSALKSLAAISGPVPLPRKNLLGIWYSRYWPYDSEEFRQIVREYSDHGFPLDNIVMDMDWHITQLAGVKRVGQIWTGYTWDRKLLPDAEDLLRWFHEQGLHVTLNDHPADGVQPHERMYADFMRAMGADPNTNQALPFDAGDRKYLQTFYAYTHRPLERAGVDFWWLDWQQFQFTRSVANLSNLAWLNRFYFQQSEADGKRGASFSRWGGWGDQKHPIHFSGDANTGWAMLAFEVPFTSTAGNVGCFFWTHDIGGHWGERNAESYARWCQFGALSAALRSHSTRDATLDRRPWTYPQWAEDSMRGSFRLRARLFPYIYSSAAQSSRETIPLLRPAYIEHPELEPAYHNAQEYYFSDDLLVAPIATAGVGPSRLAWQKVWFPPGTWFDYFTGERYDGGEEGVVAADIDECPLFVRGGVPIPMRDYTPRPATAPLNHLILRCYPGPDGETGAGALYEDDGQTREYQSGAQAWTGLSYRRTAGSITIDISPTAGHYNGQSAQRSYTVELPDLQRPDGALIDGTAGKVDYDPASWTARVEISPHPVDRAIEVVVKADIADAQTIHRQAVAARLSGIVGRAVGAGAVNRMIGDAVGAARDPSLAAGILAAGGVAVVRANDAPYLYNGHETLRFFAAPGVLDSDSGTAALQSASLPDNVTPWADVKLADGTDLDLKALCDQLPPEDSVIVPSRTPILRLTAKVDGQDCEIAVPASVAAPAELDLARRAMVTASSTEGGYDPSGAVDGVADGYPGDKRHEWASNHERAGAAITLRWDSDQTMSRVLLFDRPNLTDQVLAGRIVFSDGSAVPFGELPNDGKTGLEVRFKSRTVRWLRVEITQVSAGTQSAGLAEIAVFR
ncbi:MAG: TIM-barrel domain-containing protein [Tepidisphaeraceae bacterium]|jgi:alpha-glucosidase (family GH31 glycosyl hydrolase)